MEPEWKLKQGPTNDMALFYKLKIFVKNFQSR